MHLIPAFVPLAAVGTTSACRSGTVALSVLVFSTGKGQKALLSQTFVLAALHLVQALLVTGSVTFLFLLL